MSFKDSRYIGLFDVPDPKSLVVRFVYNFFVPDERTNASGAPTFQGIPNEDIQREVSDKTLETSLPRYVEIQFSATHAGYDDIKDLPPNFLANNSTMIQTEETITTPRDSYIKLQDPLLTTRIRQKAALLSSFLGVDSEVGLGVTDVIIARDPSIDADLLENVLSDSDIPGIQFVNEVGDVFTPPVFAKASTTMIDMLADRRLLRPIFGGNYDAENSTKTELLRQADLDALAFLPNSSDDSGESSNHPRLTTLSAEKLEGEVDQPGPVKAMTVGYVIERSEKKADGSRGEDAQYFIEGAENTNFLDTRVLYGSTYKYTVRTVALIETRVPIASGPLATAYGVGWYKIQALIASRPTPQAIVLATETIAPNPPDGVFYHFDYDNGSGLFIRWQIPTGKQRDVKYFQVFKRKSIYEPFTCIAELDFDDSVIRSPNAERVNPDKRQAFSGPVTIFYDPAFKRESSEIYAVVAVDAHRLSSGLSAQSLVSFDKVKNVLKLKSISRAGAPKQYPNFFVDPKLDDNTFVDSLTQDSMQSSKKFSVKAYFDPDAHTYSSAGGATQPLVMDQNSNGVYKLHLLNTDRQKGTVLELRVNDIQKHPRMVDASTPNPAGGVNTMDVTDPRYTRQPHKGEAK